MQKDLSKQEIETIISDAEREIKSMFRSLVLELGISQKKLAKEYGIPDRDFRSYCNPESPKMPPRVLFIAIRTLVIVRRIDQEGESEKK
jgi:hypothetical protein